MRDNTERIKYSCCRHMRNKVFFRFIQPFLGKLKPSGGRTKISCIILILLFLPNITFGEIYKWTDKNGTLHFSDKPSAKSKKISIPTLNSLPEIQIQIPEKQKSENETNENLVQVFKKYYLDKSSFTHFPEYVEKKKEFVSIAGIYITRTIYHPEHWEFKIINRKKAYECYLTCHYENGHPSRAHISPDYHFPPGVDRYFLKNVCGKD
ncbi:MAG: DUF4124 domain-containing protein [Desulfuromonadales bacterium]